MTDRAATTRTFHLVQSLASVGVAVAVTLAVVAGFAVYWRRFGLVDLPFGTHPAVALSVAVGLGQAVRIAWLNDRTRRVGAACTVPGVALALVGLGPVAYCEDSLPPTCGTTLDPDPLFLAGVGLLAAGVFLDVRAVVDGRESD